MPTTAKKVTPRKTTAKETAAEKSSASPKARYFGALRAVSGKLDPLASRLPLSSRLPKPGQMTERYIGLVDRGLSMKGRLPRAGRLKVVAAD